jgi:hypothetical protein
MADSSGSLARALVIAALYIGANACSSDSTSSTSRSIVGHVTIDPGEARIPAENVVGARDRATLTPLVSRRGQGSERVNVVFRGEAIGMGQLGAMSVRSIDRAREVGASIRARLASQPSASMFTVTDVSPAIGAARLRITDPSQRDAIMSALRADPAVAAVDVDHLLSRGPESKVKLTKAMVEQIRDARKSSTPGASGFTFATAAGSRIQYWNYNLIDAPRAWGIPDTGSAAVTVR